ncbi:hypothetical protein DPMN_083457 [Dreissena polymorpha]|uniref:Uncharacterized protein n=1 Tax=Dreissena polymorpha TaxID=45954 RepID=A0A9D3YBZ0_DREPO|nr:hypothetical protein DPMN_083457 [Dreissena polymorpha]
MIKQNKFKRFSHMPIKLLLQSRIFLNLQPRQCVICRCNVTFNFHSSEVGVSQKNVFVHQFKSPTRTPNA